MFWLAGISSVCLPPDATLDTPFLDLWGDPDSLFPASSSHLWAWAALVSVSLPAAEFVLFAMHCHVCIAVLLVASHPVPVTTCFLTPVPVRRCLCLARLAEDQEVAGGRWTRGHCTSEQAGWSRCRTDQTLSGFKTSLKPKSSSQILLKWYERAQNWARAGHLGAIYDWATVWPSAARCTSESQLCFPNCKMSGTATPTSFTRVACGAIL